VSAPAEEVLDLEDAEALSRTEVRAAAFRQPGKPGAEDLERFSGQAGAQFRFFETCLELDEGVPFGAEPPQVGAGGEPEEMRGGEGGAEGDVLGGLVEGLAQLEVHGRGDVGHGRSSGAPKPGGSRCTPPCARAILESRDAS
jgi:hypothetical protein